MKEKKSRKAERKYKKEQVIAHHVRMGEDRDVMQEELELESSTDSGNINDSEDEESQYEDVSSFATGTTDSPGASSSVPEARKRAADEDATREEAKRAQVEQCSEVP
jgi:hypothetical protein